MSLEPNANQKAHHWPPNVEELDLYHPKLCILRLASANVEWTQGYGHNLKKVYSWLWMTAQMLFSSSIKQTTNYIHSFRAIAHSFSTISTVQTPSINQDADLNLRRRPGFRHGYQRCSMEANCPELRKQVW